MCNIVDCSRRSTSYECRLAKYANRGFSIILPRLDVSKLVDEHCDLPHMTFNYTSVVGNAITADHINGGNVHDYSTADMCKSIVVRHNIGCLMSCKYDELWYYGKNLDAVLNEHAISLVDLNRSYAKTFRAILNGQVLFKTICTRFQPHLIDQIVALKIDRSPTWRQRNKLQAMINEQVQYLKDRIPLCATPVKWMTKNAMTQLTSSFNPIIEDECHWYDEYFLAK